MSVIFDDDFVYYHSSYRHPKHGYIEHYYCSVCNNMCTKNTSRKEECKSCRKGWGCSNDCTEKIISLVCQNCDVEYPYGKKESQPPRERER